MEEIYRKLLIRDKIVPYNKKGTMNNFFLKMILNTLALLIILTKNSGTAFSLVVQNRGTKLETHSYKQFKDYQRKMRLASLLAIALLIIIMFLVKIFL